MVRKETVDYIQSLNVAPGTTQRGRCPRCGSRGSFVVSNESGKLLWVCFRASCGEKGGIQRKDLTGDEVSDIVAGPSKKKSTPTFKCPTTLHYEASPEAAFLIEKYGCLDAVKENRMLVGYDQIRNRLVVFNNVGNAVVDAIGRSLTNPPTQPKWLRYGNSEVPFLVPADKDVLTNTERDEVIIVEDALSGGMCSQVRDTLVLMGTHLTDSYIAFISRNYHRVFLLLDPGAEDKEVELLKKLDPWTEAFCHFLKDDPKDINPKDIRELISMYKGEELKKRMTSE